MCDIDIREPVQGELQLRCKTTGKPISQTNSMGMFCEDLCDMDKCRQADIALKAFLHNLLPGSDFSKF